MGLELVPVGYKEACLFITRLHRHHLPPQGWKFGVAAASDGEIVGVITVGRPVARFLDNGWTLEVTRCCTDGTKNAPSFLYGAAWRVAKNLWYKRLITYILKEEPGTTLISAGWKCVGEAGGGNWNHASRPRIDTPNQGKKTLFEIS